MHDFIVLCMDHLENTALLSYADLWNWIYFMVETKKNSRLLIIALGLIRNFLENWEDVKLTGANTRCQKF